MRNGVPGRHFSRKFHGHSYYKTAGLKHHSPWIILFNETLATDESLLTHRNDIDLFNKHHGLLFIYRSGLRTMPNNAKIHYNYANLQRDMGDWDQAVYHYRQALQYIIKLSIIYCAVGWGPFIMIKSLIAFRDRNNK